jgi:hypothetical protein
MREIVRREEPDPRRLSNQSVFALADQLLASMSSPIKFLHQQVLQARGQEALGQLQQNDREILILRYLLLEY